MEKKSVITNQHDCFVNEKKKLCTEIFLKMKYWFIFVVVGFLAGDTTKLGSQIVGTYWLHWIRSIY